MSIKDPLIQQTRQGIFRKGKLVSLVMETLSPDDAILLFDKIQDAVKSGGGVQFNFQHGFHYIVEE